MVRKLVYTKFFSQCSLALAGMSLIHFAWAGRPSKCRSLDRLEDLKVKSVSELTIRPKDFEEAMSLLRPWLETVNEPTRNAVETTIRNWTSDGKKLPLFRREPLENAMIPSHMPLDEVLELVRPWLQFNIKEATLIPQSDGFSFQFMMGAKFFDSEDPGVAHIFMPLTKTSVDFVRRIGAAQMMNQALGASSTGYLPSWSIVNGEIGLITKILEGHRVSATRLRRMPFDRFVDAFAFEFVIGNVTSLDQALIGRYLSGRLVDREHHLGFCNAFPCGAPKAETWGVELPSTYTKYFRHRLERVDTERSWNRARNLLTDEEKLAEDFRQAIILTDFSLRPDLQYAR